MKQFLFAVVFLSLSSLAIGADIDTSASMISWKGTKLVGGGHDGTVKLKSGKVDFDRSGNLTGGEFEIDLNSIVNIDVKDPSYNKKLVDHLKSPDFFDVAKYPTAKFKIKSAKLDPKAKTWTIIGDLTIKGKTNQETIVATVADSGKAKIATSKIEIDRMKYDVKYNSAKIIDVKKLKDKVINDKIALDLNIKTKG